MKKMKMKTDNASPHPLNSGLSVPKLDGRQCSRRTCVENDVASVFISPFMDNWPLLWSSNSISSKFESPRIFLVNVRNSC